MDTSKEYIKMCEEADGIQESWNPETGDYFGFAYPKNIAIEMCCGYSEEDKDSEYDYNKLMVWDFDRIKHRKKEGCFWLPRQDQLQDMIVMEEPIDPTLWKLEDFYNWCRQKSQQAVSSSLEKLWFAFVMGKKYNKMWNGIEWISV